MEKTEWSLEDVRGKRILDVGCGMGRFAEICAEAGAEVHGIDLSMAVDAAAANLARWPNVHVYQADVMNLPFRDETFDLVYSIGVLHHTPDTRAAFLQLAPLLKPGGQIAIWVYTARYQRGKLLRRLTTRLPKDWLLQLSRIAGPAYQVHRVPLVGLFSQVALPTSMNPDPEWRWLDTFDWFSPTYQWKHTSEEVEGWFREAGLTEIRRGRFPVSVRGERPRRAVR